MNDFAGMDCPDSVFSLPVAGCKLFTLGIVHLAYSSHSSGLRIAAVSACTLLGRRRSVSPALSLAALIKPATFTLSLIALIKDLLFFLSLGVCRRDDLDEFLRGEGA